MTVFSVVVGGMAFYTLLCVIFWPWRRARDRVREARLVWLFLAQGPRSRRALTIVTDLGPRALDRALDTLARSGALRTEVDNKGKPWYGVRNGTSTIPWRA